MSSANAGRYTLIGSNGSPYSLKMRAVMRYRRLPFDWVLRTDRNMGLLADMKPALVPVLKLPEDDSLHLDSTPIIAMLEERHPKARSIVPQSPGQGFLAHLIEDMADEWCTKMMFHYRWAYDADIDYASHWIADDFFPDLTGEARHAAARKFAERQISRMPLVGCTAQNAPVIEAGYHRILSLLESHVGQHEFLFGTRPSLADFGLYGQFRVLATDPTPLAIMRAEAQRTESWLRQLDDASGIEGDWVADEKLPTATQGLVRFAAEVYLPFLAANATAIAEGKETFELTLLGQSYAQGTFGYQVKCLNMLKQRFAALEAEAQRQVSGYLEGTQAMEILTTP